MRPIAQKRGKAKSGDPTPEKSMSPCGVSSRSHRFATFVIEMHIDEDPWTTGASTYERSYHYQPAAISLFVCQGKGSNYWV